MNKIAASSSASWRSPNGHSVASFIRTLTTSFAALSFAIVVGVSCTPAVHVGTAHDPSLDPGRFKTFAMIDPNRPVHSKNTEVDPFVLLRLRQLTYLKLREMGLRPASKSQADLLVDVLASRDEEIRVYSSGPYDYGYLYGPRWSTYVTRIEEGVVVIDLVDREKQSVVWRGTGVTAIQRRFQEQELREVVDAILAQYPPRAKDAR